MPFAENSCLVACLMQDPGAGKLGGVKTLPKPVQSVLVAVFSCKNGGPAGGTNGIGAIDIGKSHPFFSQPVYVHGGSFFCKDPSIAADGLGGMVVCHDEQDVRGS